MRRDERLIALFPRTERFVDGADARLDLLHGGIRRFGGHAVVRDLHGQRRDGGGKLRRFLGKPRALGKARLLLGGKCGKLLLAGVARFLAFVDAALRFGDARIQVPRRLLLGGAVAHQALDRLLVVADGGLFDLYLCVERCRLLLKLRAFGAHLFDFYKQRLRLLSRLIDLRAQIL